MTSLPMHLIKTYIQRRKGDLEVLQKSISENSIEVFHHIGHQLSGNARNFGFPELENLGVKMEKITSKSLLEDGPLLVAELSAWLSRKNSEGLFE